MDDSKISPAEEADIEMVIGEMKQDLPLSDETARVTAEDIVEREIPSASSYSVEEERIARANERKP